METQQKTPENDVIISGLIGELTQSRQTVDKDIEYLENLRDRVLELFPKDSDYRSKFVLADKIKAVSALSQSLLGHRQERRTSIEKEIELRIKHMKKQVDPETQVQDHDIRGMVDSVDKKIENDFIVLPPMSTPSTNGRN